MTLVIFVWSYTFVFGRTKHTVVSYAITITIIGGNKKSLIAAIMYNAGSCKPACEYWKFRLD